MSGPRWEAAADLVVVGSGVAGLTAARTARAAGLRVLVVTKGLVASGNTGWAQGGVAVVLPQGAAAAGGRTSANGEDDTIAAHVADTMTAAAGLADEAAVATIVGDGPAAVERLIAAGAEFDRDDDGGWARAREGGHHAFRILHAGGDATGAEVQRALTVAAERDRVPVLENHVATEVVRDRAGRVAGLAVVDPAGVAGMVAAPAVLLATGGIGQLYQVSSNPAEATGDGIALALRAGVRVADLEFVQFHPTALAVSSARVGRAPLVTEALRGEGAVVVDSAGDRVMAGVHPLADLAPRDVVSGAIVRRMAMTSTTNVFLDATHLGRERFQKRFPTVYAACQAAGVDPVVEPIPIAPAAHFSCGGAVTTVDGRTDVPGLYAAGEVARTGLHGANRLASNSLLEGLVMAERVVRAVRRDLRSGLLARSAPEFLGGSGVEAAVEVGEVRAVMSRYVGIGRDADGLAVAGSTLAGVGAGRTRVDADAALVARAVVEAASARRESRGCHVRTDYPDRSEAWRHSLEFVLADGRIVPVNVREHQLAMGER